MFNPQMIGMNFNNIPTTAELWKQEKNKYRHWIILFGIGILLVLAFHLTAYLLNFFDKENIIRQLENQYENNKSEIGNAVKINWISNYIIFPALIFILLFVGLILYIVTIFKSYSEKSFARISLWLIYVIGFGALFSFINLIMLLASKNSLSLDSLGRLFAFINYILFVVIYLTSGTRVNKIRKKFAYSEYVEKLKKDQQFIKWQNHLQNAVNNQTTTPFSAPISPYAPIKEDSSVVTSPTPPIDLKLQEQYSKLKTMSLSKLKIVAKKLSISGFELMKKDELIETIMRVSSTKK